MVVGILIQPGPDPGVFNIWQLLETASTGPNSFLLESLIYRYEQFISRNTKHEDVVETMKWSRWDITLEINIITSPRTSAIYSASVTSEIKQA